VPNANPLPHQTPTRLQVPGSTAFNGGEGCFHADGTIYITTKGDNRVWAYTIATAIMAVLYDDNLLSPPILTGVDNVNVPSWGIVYVAEDGGDMQVVGIDATTHAVFPVLQVTGHASSEITGLAFDPSGTRLYFSSQRGAVGAAAGPGVTYEVTGPFASI
jgi:secreted PhoX family phosphatase